MANKVKKSASSFIVWIIVILLVVGLAGFGIGNFGNTIRAVGAVGQTEVEINAYGRALQQRLAEIQQQTGETLPFSQAQAMGLDTAVLQQMLATAALDEAARKAGLSVGDAAVSAQILAIPAFQGVDGAFNRQAYDMALDRAGMNVAQFEESIRTELSRGLLQTALVAGVAPLPAFSDTIYAYLGEARSFTHARLGPDALDTPPAPPTEEEIAAYYEAHPAEFTKPEIRRISYVLLTPEMLVDEVDLDETALRALYEDRAEEYRRPERRLVDRLVFPDADAARDARTRLDAGEVSFEDLVAGRGLELGDVDLGEVTERDLGPAGEAVFATEDTGVVGPVETGLGPALIRVNAIMTAQETPYEEALPDLREELAAERARRLIEAEVEPMNDLLAGGATLEELAQESEMSFGTLDWTGSETEGPAAYEAFRAAADAVREDDYPEIEHLEDGGIFALRVDETVPPTLQPLDSVRDQAAEGAAAARTVETLRAKAEEMVNGLEENGTLAELGLETETSAGVTRRSYLETLPEDVLTTAFEMAPGEIRILGEGEAVWLVQLDTVTPADPASPMRAQLRDGLDGQVGAQMADDILTAFARAVQEQEGISINQSALNAVHAQMP